MNICLFLVTTNQLIHHWRGVATVFQGKLIQLLKTISPPDHHNSMKGAARENFILVAKLFFIMGKILAHSQKSNKKMGIEEHLTLLVFCYQVLQEFLGWGSLSRNGLPTHKARKSTNSKSTNSKSSSHIYIY